MKFIAVVFSAMVALATVNCHYLPKFGEGPLYEDVQYFLDLIPMDKVSTIVIEYAAEDAEFQELLKYFGGDDFKTMIKNIEAIPEFKHFADYLQKHGIYIYDELNKLNKIIGIPPYQNTYAGKTRITGGLKGLFQDVKALVNYDSFIHGYVYKMRISDAFRDFVAELKSPNHQGFVNHLYEVTDFLFFRGMLVKKGLDIALIEDVIYVVLGIEFPVFNLPPSLYADNQLSKDIHDFIELIDINKIIEIVLSYTDDDEIQKAMLYMYSEEFHELIRTIEAMPEYQDLVNYLQDTGLNMYNFIDSIHYVVGMEPYVPPKHNGNDQWIETLVNRGGLKGLVDDVIAVLPLDKFKALYEEKMKSSPAFQNLMAKLRSDEFQKILNTLYSSKIFLEMRQKAIDAGLNLEPIRKVISDMLGIHIPTVPPQF